MNAEGGPRERCAGNRRLGQSRPSTCKNSDKHVVALASSRPSHASDAESAGLEAVGPEVEATAAEVIRREEALTEAVHLEGDPKNGRGLRPVLRKRQISPPGMPCATGKADSHAGSNTLPPP